jgi:hypothetical protein
MTLETYALCMLEGYENVEGEKKTKQNKIVKHAMTIILCSLSFKEG